MHERVFSSGGSGVYMCIYVCVCVRVFVVLGHEAGGETLKLPKEGESVSVFLEWGVNY